jgi:hypothetical protein
VQKYRFRSYVIFRSALLSILRKMPEASPRVRNEAPRIDGGLVAIGCIQPMALTVAGAWNGKAAVAA